VIFETVREYLTAEPFLPFVVRASIGIGHPVLAPDLAVVMKTTVFIAQPRSDKSATVSYLHITAVKDPGDSRTTTRPARPRAGGPRPEPAR